MKKQILAIFLLLFFSHSYSDDISIYSEPLLIEKYPKSIILESEVTSINRAREVAREWCKSNGYDDAWLIQLSSGINWVDRNKGIERLNYKCKHNSDRYSHDKNNKNPYFSDEELEIKSKHSFTQKKEVPIKFDIEKASETCLDLGFKKDTKKYKNCIIEIL